MTEKFMFFAIIYYINIYFLIFEIVFFCISKGINVKRLHKLVISFRSSMHSTLFFAINSLYLPSVVQAVFHTILKFNVCSV